MAYIGVLLDRDNSVAKAEAQKLRGVWPKGYQTINNNDQDIFVIDHEPKMRNQTLAKAGEVLGRKAIDRSSIQLASWGQK
jgi:hypothetical protein